MSSPPFDAEKYKVLMSGLEYSEVKFQSIDDNLLRLEAEYYTAHTQHYNSIIGEDATLFVQYGTSKELNENNQGYPTLRLNEINSGFIEHPQKFCDHLSESEFSKLSLKRDDVLICRTNGNPNYVGKSAVCYEDYPYAFASYLYRVRVDCNIILPQTLSSFLNGKYGRQEILKQSMHSNQVNFSPAKFKKIRIPLLSESLNQVIKFVCDKAYHFWKEINVLYSQAQNILAHELGLDNWQPSKEKISVRSVAEVEQAGRWDAEYYQPKYDEILSLAQDVPNKRLGSIVTIEKSIEPGSSAYQDEGIPFLRVQDLTIHGFGETEIHLDPIAFRDAPRVKADTILLTKDGTVGIAYKVEQDEDAITSGAILHLHLNDNDINPNYLTLVLNSPVAKLQAEQDAGGSVIQHWKPSEIEKVVIPLLPYAIQERISNKVQDAFKLRHQSRHLLNAAKRAVEIAIEEDENAALTYLSSQTDMFTDEEYSTDVSQPYLKVAEPEVGNNTNIDKGIKADERT